MKEIPLTQGKVAIVDDIDFEYLMAWKWCFAAGYAKRASRKSEVPPGNKRKTIYMHRVVMNRKLGHNNVIGTDHKNTDGLDNRRSNLRPASQSQNGGNRKSPRKFKGVYYKPYQKWVTYHKWIVTIRFQGKSKYIGRFDDEIEAAKAYNKAAIECFGEFAKLNDV